MSSAAPALLKYIAHLDLDCFFVSVERIRDPSLIGKPVIVGGSATGRGVVASASYEAREFGVRSAMPTGQALRLCPQAIVISGHHGEYSEHSDRLYRRMLELAPVVERASIDEMYMDFSGCEKLYHDDLPGFMKRMQAMIRDEFRLPCTIALAANKMVAKIAANTVKPAGVIFVPHGSEREFLAPLPIEVIPGVGKKTAALLQRKGLHLVSDVQALTQRRLGDILGLYGSELYRAANGIGSDLVEPEHTRKSISREETFATDLIDPAQLEAILLDLVEDVCSTLRSHSRKAQTVTLKLRSSDFRTITRRLTLPPTDYDPEIFSSARGLFRKAFSPKTPVRLLGVALSGFGGETEPELPLFSETTRRSEILNAVDRLRKKYGDDVIHVGRT